MMELRDIGLDHETLQNLVDPRTASPVALHYQLNTSTESRHVKPQLTVCVHIKDGCVVDASLAPASRAFLEHIASELPNGRRGSSVPVVTDVAETSNDSSTISHPAASSQETSSLAEEDDVETIEVPLVFDNRFFEILQSDVNNIDALQAEEQKAMSKEIMELGKEVSRVAKPARFSSSDLTRWRHIFELYLDAEVFFATHEQTHGARTSKDALRQLQWFQSEVEKRNLVKSFKIPESQVAFARFLKLNLSLLKNLQFQELNKLAVMKILKKFDKRTCFGISKSFRTAIHSPALISGNIGKDVCAQLSQELLPIVPQINDYLCPVCYAIAYLPVRLACQHVYCIRCIVKMQRRKEKQCPLCRANVVMNASLENLDNDLTRYMQRYFAKEVKQKQRENDIERGIEDYGPSYTHKECTVM